MFIIKLFGMSSVVRERQVFNKVKKYHVVSNQSPTVMTKTPTNKTTTSNRNQSKSKVKSVVTYRPKTTNNSSSQVNVKVVKTVSPIVLSVFTESPVSFVVLQQTKPSLNSRRKEIRKQAHVCSEAYHTHERNYRVYMRDKQFFSALYSLHKAIELRLEANKLFSDPELFDYGEAEYRHLKQIKLLQQEARVLEHCMTNNCADFIVNTDPRIGNY